MKLNDVFYGFTTDGKYRCLQKKVIIYHTNFGLVKKVVYIDLEEKQEIDKFFVDEQTLQPITKIVGMKKRKTRRKVVKQFQLEVDKKINISTLFYGNVVTFKNKEKGKVSIGYVPIEDTICVEQEKDVLFRGTSNGFAKRLSNDRDYFIINNQIEEVTLGNEFIGETRKINASRHFPNGDFMKPKRKVLEMDYRKEL